MVLYIYLFDSKCAGHCDNVFQWLMRPFSWSIDKLLSSFKSTTKEVSDRDEAPCYQRYVILTFLVPALLILILLTAPLFLIAFLCWMPLQKSRHPFRYSCQNTSREVQLWSEKEHSERVVRITSINTSLLREYESRQSNLGDTQQRAQCIVNAIVESQTGATHPTAGGHSRHKRISLSSKAVEAEEIILTQSRSMERSMSLPYDTMEEGKLGSVTHGVTRDFLPHTDIVCMQGIFDSRTQQIVSAQLHRSYPHIICDVGIYSWATNQCREGSGLITASRYPIMDASFKCFSSRSGNDTKRSKGALFTKLEIGKSSEGKTLVGFVANTHLQDGLGFAGVRTRQLNELRTWHRDFRDSATAEREIVVFDFLCGNLSFDNMSTADRENWTHDFLNHFTDPCRRAPGKDTSWALGTELLTDKIHEPDVSTPEGLKIILEDPSNREMYLQQAEVEGPRPEHEMGMGSRGSSNVRRVNYIIMSRDMFDEAYEARLTEYSYITRLTSMTVHLPISCGLIISSTKH